MLRNRIVARQLTVLSAAALVSTMLACDSHPLYTQVDCGNGIVDGTEECDGTELGSVNCADLGFTTGTLGCNTQCTFDTSGCSNAGSCGDGTLDTGEQCDGSDLAGEACTDRGYTGGTLACDTSCDYDETGC